MRPLNHETFRFRARRARAFGADCVRQLFENRSLREMIVFGALAVACATLAVAFAILVAPFDNAGGIPLENGWYESVQSAMLAATFVAFLAATLRFRGEIFYFAIFASFFAFFAGTREIPRCNSAFYDGGLCLTSNAKTTSILVIALVLICIFAAKRVRFPRIGDEATFFYAVPIGFCFLFLLGSEIFSHLVFVWPEEISELSAYALVLGFAITLNLRPSLFEVRGPGDP